MGHPWVRSITIAWEFVGTAHSQGSPRPTESETLDVGPGSLYFIKPPGHTEACFSLQTIVLFQNRAQNVARYLFRALSLSRPLHGRVVNFDS